MFCADYIAVYVYHGIITVGTINFLNTFYKTNVKGNSSEDVHSERKIDADRKKIKLIVLELAASGLGLQLTHNKISTLPSTKEKKDLKMLDHKNNFEMSESFQNNKFHNPQPLLIPFYIETL